METSEQHSDAILRSKFAKIEPSQCKLKRSWSSQQRLALKTLLKLNSIHMSKIKAASQSKGHQNIIDW